MMALALAPIRVKNIFNCRSVGVLRFIQDDKSIIQCTATHISKRCNLNGARTHIITQFISRYHIIQCIV